MSNSDQYKKRGGTRSLLPISKIGQQAKASETIDKDQIPSIPLINESILILFFGRYFLLLPSLIVCGFATCLIVYGTNIL